MYVEAAVATFRTRVQLPAPPPNLNIKYGFLYPKEKWQYENKKSNRQNSCYPFKNNCNSFHLSGVLIIQFILSFRIPTCRDEELHFF